MPDDPEHSVASNRRQWARALGQPGTKERVPADRAGGASGRWNKAQWIGEDRRGHRPVPAAPDQMPEGDPRISGNRHNPDVQASASGSSNDAAATEGADLPSTRIHGHLRAALVPWDDSDFVHDYEIAYEQVVREGLLLNGPRAAARLEELMRAAGYSRVSVEVERTVDEALRHAARWTVRRDGGAVSDGQ